MRKFVSKTAEAVEPSGIRKFFDMAESIPGAISLGVGEPDFNTPEPIRRAAVEAIMRGETHYTSNRGLIELRRLISRYLKERFNVEYTPERTVITVGASEAVDLAMRAVCDAGDEILLPEPFYVSYAPAVTLTGGVPIPVKCRSENGFVPTKAELESAITPRTKAIMLSFPNNPTGAVATRAQLEEIAEVAMRRDLLVITDEIYAELTYCGEHFSIASLPRMNERTVYIGGFSKAFAMTGWRTGFICAPAEIDEAVFKIHQHAIICAPRAGQFAAVHALKNGFENGFAEIKKMRDEYEKRGKMLSEGLNGLGLECIPPHGAFYVFANVKSTGMTGEEFAEKLLKSQKVAVVPGIAFGETGRYYIRCSYAASTRIIAAALKGIERFLAEVASGND